MLNGSMLESDQALRQLAAKPESVIITCYILPRRQAVRHLTLTQAFGGSNPSGAAISVKPSSNELGFFVAQ